jgi:hypothetical protein
MTNEISNPQSQPVTWSIIRVGSGAVLGQVSARSWFDARALGERMTGLERGKVDARPASGTVRLIAAAPAPPGVTLPSARVALRERVALRAAEAKAVKPKKTTKTKPKSNGLPSRRRA